MQKFETGGRQPIIQIRFRADGTGFTAARRRSAELCTWDVGGQTAHRSEPFPVHAITCFEYSADGMLLAVGDDQGIARPCELPGLGTLAELRVGYTEGRYAPSPVRAVGFAPSSEVRWRWLAAAGVELWLWNPVTREYLCAPDPGQYTALAFAPDGLTLVAADLRAGALIGWQVKPFREVFRIDIPTTKVVRRLLWLPDAESLLVSDETHVRCVSTEGEELWQRPAGSTRGGADLALGPEGRFVAVAAGEQTVRLLDPFTGQLLREYDWGIGKVSAVAVCPDGTMAAAGGERGQVMLWDLDG